MYAAGASPVRSSAAKAVRARARSSPPASSTAPLRPCFVKGDEVQVVATVMALNPEVLYDVVAINAASASTTLGQGLPFSGPIGGVRVALIGSTWVGFPTVKQLEDATFDMVITSHVRMPDGDVAIRPSPPRPRGTWSVGSHRPDRGGRGPGPRAVQEVHQGPVRRAGRAAWRCSRRRPSSSRSSSTTSPTCSPLSRPQAPTAPVPCSPSRASRSARPRPRSCSQLSRTSSAVSSRTATRRSPSAYHSPLSREGRASPHAHRARPHRPPWRPRHPHCCGRGRRAPARPRLRPVHARRDPILGVRPR